jgi:hypothetical protein
MGPPLDRAKLPLTNNDVVKCVRDLGVLYQPYALALEEGGLVDRAFLCKLDKANIALLFMLVPKSHRAQLETCLFGEPLLEEERQPNFFGWSLFKSSPMRSLTVCSDDDELSSTAPPPPPQALAENEQVDGHAGSVRRAPTETKLLKERRPQPPFLAVSGDEFTDECVNENEGGLHRKEGRKEGAIAAGEEAIKETRKEMIIRHKKEIRKHESKARRMMNGAKKNKTLRAENQAKVGSTIYLPGRSL